LFGDFLGSTFAPVTLVDTVSSISDLMYAIVPSGAVCRVNGSRSYPLDRLASLYGSHVIVTLPYEPLAGV
jgi:hypothetical protein